jgi:hypothetical protein
MRFSTDDDRFGFVVTPVHGAMFRFQIIVARRLIGTDEACILGSAMHRLRSLNALADQRLGFLPEDPGAVSLALRTDEALHDAATLSLAESLDEWLVHGYVFNGKVTILAQHYEGGELAGPVLVSVLEKNEYDQVIGAAYDYWTKARGGQPG